MPRWMTRRAISKGADLKAARRACPGRLDFAGLLLRVEEILG